MINMSTIDPTTAAAADFATRLIHNDKSVSDALDHAFQKYGVATGVVERELLRRASIRDEKPQFCGCSTSSSASGIVV